MSTLSAPASSITLRSLSSSCELIASVCSILKACPDIDGIPMKLCDRHAATTPPLSFNDQAASLSASSAETECESGHYDDFMSSYHQYGRTAHMGLLDPSYQIFTSQHGHGAVVYKIKNRTLIVTGDPLCSPELFQPLLDELRQFRAKRRLKLAFMGVSKSFVEYAQKLGWVTLNFGRERVINPTTNPVLRKGAGKRMISQSRQLLDPKRCGLSVNVYSPSTNGREPALEVELQRLYDCWREDRNNKLGMGSQAFVTVYDLFSHPDVTMFVYTKDRDGCANGLAVLRSLGANGGFHLDPCIASSTAPRGVSDLLVIACMKLLSRTGLDYMSMGYEPYADLQDITGQSSLQAWFTQMGYRRVMQAVPVNGKAAYYNKFRPDDDASSDLYIVIPHGLFQVQQSTALMHIANLKMTSLFSMSDKRASRTEKKDESENREKVAS